MLTDGKSQEQGFGPWKLLMDHMSRVHSGHSAEASPLQGWLPQGRVRVLPRSLLSQVKEGPFHLRKEEQ